MIPDFETVTGSIKTQPEERVYNLQRNKSMKSAKHAKQMDHFSIYSDKQSNTSPEFDSLYKKIALIIESVVLVCLLILILKKVSLFKVFNVVTAICFPVICVITPSYFYIASIKKFRGLRLGEYVLTGTMILLGIIIFILSFINVVFFE
jgi:predicted membrane channel-forming protein YqfA (hemolysin III family)